MNADFRINGKVIETERLILRPFRQTDLEDFYEYASVEGVGEMAGWKHHESIAESQSIMNSFISNDKVFAICLLIVAFIAEYSICTNVNLVI